MKVCIAEKPSVAKEIAQVLGAKSRKDGYFEGNGYQITWTFGHLCTLKEPQDYHESLKKWRINSLPIIPPKFGIKLIANNGVKKQFETIKKLVANAEEVINCGDAGQEGELIQRWVLQKAQCQVPIKRLWISSLTTEAIRGGFQDLKEGTDYDKLYWAGSSRAIGDWLLGINATRLYTLKYGEFGNLLSIGRVQTPTLAMIVDRHHEITNFKSKTYWELITLYKKAKFNCQEGKIEDKAKAEQLLYSVQGHELEIKSFERKEGKESAPKLFDLTSLQVACNKKIALSADETLKIAQQLYERKFITYPRVDTRYLPEDIYPTIEGILKSMHSYSELAKPLIGQPIRKSKNVFNDKKITDHHAIIPTNVTAGNLGHQEQKVYDLIAKNFLANFYPDCKVSKTTVLAESNSIPFKATGKEIIEPGWRHVYGKEKVEEESDKKKGEESEDNQILPDFTVGERGPHDPKLDEKQTKAPKLYTEATLLRAMETAGKKVDDEEMRELMKENGIGRPSTRANIIETLFRRKYIIKKRKNLIPTTTGIELIATINNDLLKSAELTGTWERHLRQIESGEYEVGQFMSDMKEMVFNLVKEVRYDNATKRIGTPEEPKKQSVKKEIKEVALTCPKCGKGNMLKGKQAYGCSLFKTTCQFTIPFEHFGKKLSDTQLKSLITKKATGSIKGLVLDDKKVEGRVKINEHLQFELEVKEAEKLTCPACKQGTLLKGNRAYGCSQYKSGCKFVVPFTYMEKKLSDSQLKQLVVRGRTSVIKKFKDSAGNSVDGRLFLNSDNRISFEKS